METFQTLNPRKQMKLQFLRKNFVRSRRTRRGVIISVNKVFGGRLEPRRAAPEVVKLETRLARHSRRNISRFRQTYARRVEENRIGALPSPPSLRAYPAMQGHVARSYGIHEPKEWHGEFSRRGGPRRGRQIDRRPVDFCFRRNIKIVHYPSSSSSPLSPSERIPETVLCVSH